MWPASAAISDRELVLRGRDAQRANHHRGQGIGELALEHRAFAGHHAMMFWNFVLRNGGKISGKRTCAVFSK